MNALKARQRYDSEKSEEAFKERMKKEQEYIDSLSDEDRKKYLEEQKEQEIRLAQLLAIGVDLGGPYSRAFK